MERRTINLSIKILKDLFKGGDYDYLLNWNDDEYSWIKIVDDEKDIDYNLEGWYIWCVKDLPTFIQTVNRNNIRDYHCLTDKEVKDLVSYFMAVLK